MELQGEGRHATSEALQKSGVEKDDLVHLQGQFEDHLEAKDGTIAGLKEQTHTLTPKKGGKIFAEQSCGMTVMTNQSTRMWEMLESWKGGS